MARILFQAGAEKLLIFESSFALTLRNKTCGFPGSSFISLSCLNVISLPASLSHATIVACIKRSPIAFPLPSRTALEFTSKRQIPKDLRCSRPRERKHQPVRKHHCLSHPVRFSLKLKPPIAGRLHTGWIAHRLDGTSSLSSCS